jgi:hypothetical protein
MNEHEIERIADAMHHARPDWPVKQLRTLISEKLADRPRRDVFVALAWVACEPATASPYRVLEAGPWWKAAAVEGTLVPRHPTPDTFCQNCGRELGNCCDRPTRRLWVMKPRESAAIQAEIAATREALRTTHAELTPTAAPALSSTEETT